MNKSNFFRRTGRLTLLSAFLVTLLPTLSAFADVPPFPPSISVTPLSRDYGTLTVGQSATQAFTLANTGGLYLTGTVTVASPFYVTEGSPFNVPGGTSTLIKVAFTPSDIGTFSNKVSFNSNAGGLLKAVMGKAIAMPVALFNGTPVSGVIPLTVTFTDNSTGSITNRVWDFGDGTSTNTALTSFSHTYSETGTFTVVLALAGPVGTDTRTRSDYITVDLPPPLLTVTPTSRDFGTVILGQSKTRVLTLVNDGGKTLTGTASAPSPFTIDSGTPYSLEPGETGTVSVTFEPLSPGAFSNRVTLTSNGGNESIPVMGDGVAPALLVVTPSSNNFGQVVTGSLAQATLVVSNAGGVTLTGSVSVAGGPFTLSTNAYSLAGYSKANVIVKFSPLAVGLYTGSVSFASNGGAATNSLLGEGVHPPPLLTYSPLSRDFGTVVLGQTRSRALTLVNRGGLTLTGTASVPAPFSVQSGSPYSLEPGQTGTLSIVFTPVASGSASNRVTLTSNGGSASVPMMGNGLPPARLVATPATVEFGPLMTGTTAQASILVTNAGGTALTGTLALASGPFSLSTNAYALAAYGWTNVGVSFLPVAINLYTSELVFASNGGTLTNLVTGEGTSNVPPVSVIRFSTGNLTGVEGTRLSITVYREGGLSGPCSIHFMTKGETAVGGSDYATKSGLLSWSNNDSRPRVIKIAIAQDNTAEPKETFTVKLKNPTRAILGTIPLTRVKIPANGALPAVTAAAKAAGVAPAVTLETALDGAGLAWQTSLQAPWLGGTEFTADGVDAAKSGTAESGTISWLQTAVEGPGTLTFEWFLKGTAADAALLLDNGAVAGRLEAGDSWAREAIYLEPGMHLLQWVYTADKALESGSAAYLDKVIWVHEKEF